MSKAETNQNVCWSQFDARASIIHKIRKIEVNTYQQ